MSWQKIIYKILGYFWLNVWKDTWLLQCIVDWFKYVLGDAVYSRLKSILNQTSCQAVVTSDVAAPVRILVDARVSSGVIPVSSLYISSSGGSYIGQTNDKAVYSRINIANIPITIQDRVKKPSIVLKYGTNYTVDKNSFVFDKPLESYGFSKTFVTIQNQLKCCYQLWGIQDTYTTLLDKFTAILQLPDYWLWKYPGAVKAAWSIQQNGSNKKDVIKLLSIIGNCPVAGESGIVHVISQNKVKIGDTQYIGHGACLVGQGEYVQENTALFSASQNPYDTAHVYTGQQELPLIVPYIHVLTQTGVLKARNTTLPVQDNVLPLEGQNFSQYKEHCIHMQQSQYVPYTELPEDVNPAQFIFNKVWGASGFLIMTPSSNQEDMNLAAQFIARNTVKGAIPVIYRFDPDRPSSPDLLYPDGKVHQEIMIYYNTSINNGYSYKERLGDFER